MMKSLFAFFFLFIGHLALAQNPSDSSSNWTIHFQLSLVQQWHGNYSFPYSGPSSLDSNKEKALSLTTTLFLGRKLWKNAALYFNPEITAGAGLSLTHGAAGFPNGEIYRVGNPTPTPFIARLYLQQNFALGSGSMEPVEDDINQIKGNLPASRITINVGKFCLADFFDDNKYDHDARTQFLNWSLMQQGAWDFPADTRGYTSGVELELQEPHFSIKYAFVQVSSTANGLDMDWDMFRYNGQTAEFATKYSLSGKAGAARFTAFMNTTRAPKYTDAVNDLMEGNNSIIKVIAGDTLGPDIPSIKYGFALNIEQAIGRDLGIFFRAGWNDGKTASWEFTDIDQNLQLGLNADGQAWKRPTDNFGIALAVNGISKDHQDYLKAGGWSFIIGDGRLNYGPEQILETYYRAKVYSYIWLSADYQLILNPGYNRDRKGPVSVPGLRVHIEI
jgi:high affinity Mn2+ porin